MKTTSSPRSTHTRIPSSIEPLESRIAPAALVVTTLKDITDAQHDTGSLRDAILLANADTGNAHIITFQTADGHPLKGTINLGSELPVITNALTINGPTSGKSNGIIIDGHNHQIFNVTQGDFTLNDLTITHGLAHYGGGLYVNDTGATITLTDVTITKNRAMADTPTLDSDGGGIYISNATLVMTNSKVTGNSAIGATGTVDHRGGLVNGGAIWTNGAATITDSTISGNVAHGGDALASSNGLSGGGAYCAGIYADGNSVLSIHHSVISGNKAIGGNGSNGAKGMNGTAGAPGQNGTDGTAGHNGGDGGVAEGGGVYAREGSTKIYDSTISGNTAQGGKGGQGGAGGKGGAGGASYTFANTFHHAGAGGNGGAGGQGGSNGIASGGGAYSNSTLEIYTSTISGNSVHNAKPGVGGAGGAAGGGSYKIGTVVHKGTNGAKGASGSLVESRGAGIYSESHLTLSQVTIANNSGANKGGGVFIIAGTASIHNCTIAHNQALTIGGGLDVLGGSVDVVSSIIALNSAKTDADVAGSFAASFDLFGTLTPDAVLTTNTSNITTAANLHLGGLGMHGGPTATMLPSLTSSAVDAGSNPDSLSVDQRGLVRILGVAIDIGAVEVH